MMWHVRILSLNHSEVTVIFTRSEALLDRHLVIAFFVPMIVGTGGNAGNQPGVMTTRALSNGALDRPTLARLFRCDDAAAAAVSSRRRWRALRSAHAHARAAAACRRRSSSSRALSRSAPVR